jgi:hypothetical protein
MKDPGDLGHLVISIRERWRHNDDKAEFRTIRCPFVLLVSQRTVLSTSRRG